MTNYRPITDAEREGFRRGRYYAFAPEDGPAAFESDDEEIMGTHRGLFDGEDLVSACSYFDFRTRVRDTWLDLGGVAGVATPPEHRRKGLVRQLMGDLLAEFHREGLAVSALWPFDHDFYARLGWAQTCTHTNYEFEPAVLSSAAADPAGEFRQLAPDVAHRLDPVFEAWLDGHSLAMRRDEEWWSRRVVREGEDERYVYAWIENGEARSYLVYDIDGNFHDGRTLTVKEFAYTDSEARCQLWRFLANHDSQIESVTATLPAETRLFDEVADPQAIECTVTPGPMVRLVSVPEAIETLAYPKDVEGTVTVAVDDPLADWNDGTFELSFADGQATCKPASDAGSDFDVQAGVGALSQLLVGYRSLDALRELDSITVEQPDGVNLLAAAFPERPVWLPERF